MREHLETTQPRLGFTPAMVADLKVKLETDPVLRNMYAAIRANAETIYSKGLPDGKIRGKRLLSTSREMLYRINMLGFVYLMEKDPRALQRINDEVLNVSAFPSWNPHHFLDVAEMSLAVSLALDWTAGDLPATTIQAAKDALIEKALQPSWPEDGKPFRRAYGDNNWNQVCNGGLIAAALTVFDQEPELATQTIHRALEGLPHSLIAYMPDGIYPEGSSYWGYGTSYSLVTISILESALGSDFGIADYPGFMESALFRALCNAPSGWYFNFSDCGDRRDENGDVLLAWFAARTGNKTFFERERFMEPVEEMNKLSNIAGMAMAWLSQYEGEAGTGLPTAWAGKGHNPIAIFTGGENDEYDYYVGCKGGQAGISHGNMDAGSFVFELNGVRWSIDPGNQSYRVLERAGFQQWGRHQGSDRWTLLIKNNFGHSTLTVNDQLFRTTGFAPLIDFKEGERPEAAFDLTELYADHVEKATRRFVKDSPTSLRIQDRIITSDQTEKVVWQMGTLADVELVNGGAILTQDGQQLELRVESNLQTKMRIVQLNPPPMKLDKQIEGFKRIEIELHVRGRSGQEIQLDVRLSAKGNQ
ncbi:MAG: heparinase II/III family protein [Pontiella sp.]